MIVEIVGQILGFIAAVFNVLSYQCKKHKNVVIMLLIGSSFFCASFLLTGAITGGILNGIGVIRCIVYSNKKTFKADNIAWFIAFCIAYVLTYVLTFTVINKEFNFKNAIVELLPVVGMVATNVSLRMTEAKHIRMLAYISSPSWLIYNIITASIGATITEIIALISVTIGIIRLDVKKKDKFEPTNETNIKN